jgi:hypothetical protein
MSFKVKKVTGCLLLVTGSVREETFHVAVKYTLPKNKLATSSLKLVAN